MAFFGIPMFGEGQVSRTLSNTIAGRGSTVAGQQLNRGLQQTRRGMMSQAAADRSNPALAVRNAMLAGSQAATDTNMQAAQLRAQEQATALQQRMAMSQQQGQQFMGQLGAIGQGLAGSGVLGPQASAALGGALGMAPGSVGGQQQSLTAAPAPAPGGNITTQGAVTGGAPALYDQSRFMGPASAVASRVFGAGGNITTPQPAQPTAPSASEVDPQLAAIGNAAGALSASSPAEPVAVAEAPVAPMRGARVNRPAGESAQARVIQLDPIDIVGNVPGPANPPPVDYGTVRDVRGIAAAPLGNGQYRAVPRLAAPAQAPGQPGEVDAVADRAMAQVGPRIAQAAGRNAQNVVAADGRVYETMVPEVMGNRMAGEAESALRRGFEVAEARPAASPRPRRSSAPSRPAAQSQDRGQQDWASNQPAFQNYLADLRERRPGWENDPSGFRGYLADLRGRRTAEPQQTVVADGPMSGPGYSYSPMPAQQMYTAAPGPLDPTDPESIRAFMSMASGR